MSNEQFIEVGSGNVWEDLGFPDAKERFIKSSIAIAIEQEIKARGLRQIEAAKLMDIKQPDVSNIINGRLKDFSIERLIRLLDKLGLDVKLSISHRTA